MRDSDIPHFFFFLNLEKEFIYHWDNTKAETAYPRINTVLT